MNCCGISFCLFSYLCSCLLGQGGDSVGELSLLADRPLWYSVMVRSAIVRVACLDLSVLRSYFEERGETEAIMRVAAEADRHLYSSAVQEQVWALLTCVLQVP